MSKKEKYYIGGIDIEKLLPKYAGYLLTTIPNFKMNSSNDDLISYVAWNNCDGWSIKKSLKSLSKVLDLSDYFKYSDETELYTMEEGSVPQFTDGHLVQVDGPEATDNDEYYYFKLYTDTTKSYLHLEQINSSDTEVVQEYTYRIKTPNDEYIAPKRVLVILQAAGGGGGGAVSHFTVKVTNGGAGGGSGALAVAILDTTADTWYFKLGRAGGGGGGTQDNELYATAANDSSLSFKKIASSGAANTWITCGGGKAGGNGPEQSGASTGGDGGKCEFNIIDTDYIWRRFIDNGVNGGNGHIAILTEDADDSYNSSKGSPGSTIQNTTITSTNSVHRIYTPNYRIIGGLTAGKAGDAGFDYNKEGDWSILGGGAGGGGASYLSSGGDAGNGKYYDEGPGRIPSHTEKTEAKSGSIGSGGGGAAGFASWIKGEGSAGGNGGAARLLIYYGSSFDNEGVASNSLTSTGDEAAH